MGEYKQELNMKKSVFFEWVNWDVYRNAALPCHLKISQNAGILKDIEDILHIPLWGWMESRRKK